MDVSTWSSGYVTDIAYDWSYFPELAPSHLDFIAMLQGHRPPREDEPFTYLELGAGLGLSSTILAAGNPSGDFYAADFNPTHVGAARSLAALGGVPNVTFLEAGFDELLASEDLPDLDYVALHGVWSWVGPEARNQVLALLRRRLKPGGLVYISYNCTVGWEGSRSPGRLLRRIAQLERGPAEKRIGAALSRIERLVGGDSGFFSSGSPGHGWVERVRGYSANYLAHEYLVAHWESFFLEEVAADLADAKLSFVGSAQPLRNYDQFVLKGAAQKLHDELDDMVLREMLKDFQLSTGLRKDVFIRGPQHETVQQLRARLRRQAFALVVNDIDLPEPDDVRTSLGSTAITAGVMAPVVEALQRGPATIAEMERQLDPAGGFAVSDVLLVCSALTDGRHVAPVPHDDRDAAVAAGQRLNRAIVQRSLEGVSINYLSAPVIGGGVATNEIERASYAVLADLPDADPATLQRLVRDVLLEHGRTIDADDPDDALASAIQHLLEQRQPRWRALGVI